MEEIVSPTNPDLYLQELMCSNSTKLMIRITKLSNQALLEIILDLEVLVYHFPSFPVFPDDKSQS